MPTTRGGGVTPSPRRTRRAGAAPRSIRVEIRSRQEAHGRSDRQADSGGAHRTARTRRVCLGRRAPLPRPAFAGVRRMWPTARAASATPRQREIAEMFRFERSEPGNERVGGCGRANVALGPARTSYMLVTSPCTTVESFFFSEGNQLSDDVIGIGIASLTTHVHFDGGQSDAHYSTGSRVSPHAAYNCVSPFASSRPSAAGATADQQHLVAPGQLAATVADHVAQQDASRAAIREALARPEVRDVASSMHVDLGAPRPRSRR